MDSQGAEVDKKLAAFDIDEADSVEFNPTRRLVCCAVRFDRGWARDPCRIAWNRTGLMTVLVVGRHVALPRPWEAFNKPASIRTIGGRIHYFRFNANRKAPWGPETVAHAKQRP